MTDDLNEAVNGTAVEDSTLVESDVIEQKTENSNSEDEEKPDWITPLQSIPSEGLHFIEFDKHEYLFKQIQDPDGTDSGRFTVFYRNLSVSEEHRKWETLKGLLSGMYTVAQVESFFKQLSSEINMVGDPKVSGAPFSLVCRSKTRQNLNFFSDMSMRIAFEIVTGLDSTQLDNVRSSIDTCIINTYDGSKRIHMDYVINSSIGSDTSKRYTDYFILSSHSHVFTHIAHSLGAIHADLENIQQFYDSTITMLKNHTTGIDEIVAELTKRMKKSTRIQMNSYWEALPNDSKNLLFALVIASHCLDNDYDVRQHIDLRSYINSLILKLFKSDKKS